MNSGVVVIILNPMGDVVAEASDFDRAGYGGFTLKQAQAYRAEKVALNRFVADHLNKWLGTGVEDYFIDAFWNNAQRAGYTLKTISIGYDDER